jgi:hypothetical protein
MFSLLWALTLAFLLLAGGKTNADTHIKQLRREKDELQTANELKLAHTAKTIMQSAWKSGTSGAIAGSIQVLSLMWLKTAVNYQYRYGGTITKAFAELYSQGGISRFYRGLSYAIIQGPLARFGGSFSNEFATVLCKAFVLDGRYALIGSTILGGILSSIWRFIIMPIDTCKTVLQVEGKLGLDRMFQTVLSLSHNIFTNNC